GPSARLEDTGDAGPDRSADDAADDGDEHVDERGQIQRIAEETGQRRAEDDLPLTADVEQTAAEGQGDAEAGEDERSARDHRFGQRTDRPLGRARIPVEDGAAEQGRIRIADGGEQGGEELSGGGEEVLRRGDDL